MNSSKKINSSMTIKQMMYIVVLSALAILLGYFEIPIFITGAKIDLSEVIIITSIFIIGFKHSLFVIFLRSLVRFFIVTPGTTGLEADIRFKLYGELVAVVASLLVVLSYFIVKRIIRNKSKPLIYEVPTSSIKVGMVEFILLPLVTTIILSVGMTVFHYFVTVPVYGEMLGIASNINIFSIVKAILVLFGLVNLFKGIISPIIYLLIKPKISDMIK